MKIALDAMGGDNAPASVIKGADIALVSYPQLEFIIFGDKEQVEPLLHKHPKLAKKSRFIHTDIIVANEEKPSVALRQGKNSSMALAIDAVKRGDADAVISAGNTGALMAMSKIALRTLPGIDRPAICSLFPTSKGQSVMLDLGANPECSAENLFQFAVMGEAYARAVLGKKDASIGLLNIGSEAGKGIDSVRRAADLLEDTHLPLNFKGFVEGNDIAMGTVDVVVADGFSGNIALKTAEGAGKLCAEYLKRGLTSSIMARCGAVLAKPALKSVFKKIDPRSHNGGMFVGLNGIVVKSHGGTDHIGFANAIEVTVNLVKDKINDRIIEEIGFVSEEGELEY
ncbi:MAG: phosphate acyltransferase [Alphaproteobacteria bacterium CG11_big_fil_rev_8_21_14_0_20_44_7]|nr:MAG: phosphate acyltransferase [Alphaproteobacteria bacterium CG11_big_fil_rev_8_21_14_0_20_44_7]